MNLKQFDGKRVRLTDVRGEVFEGVCTHSSLDWNEHIFGRREEGVELGTVSFFRSDIRRLESLEGRAYSGPWGALEALTVSDGADAVLDALEDAAPEPQLRLLRCLADRGAAEVLGDPELQAVLRDLAEQGQGEALRRAAKRLLPE